MGNITLPQLARQMSDLPGQIRAQSRVAVNASALTITNTLREQIRAASGGDMRLSGVGRRGGTRVGARYDVKGTDNPTALIRATGPLHLVENPTSPHVIPKQGATRGRGRNKRARVVVVNGRVFARVNHPGTRGKQPWRKGVTAGVPKGTRAYMNTMGDLWPRVWG